MTLTPYSTDSLHSDICNNNLKGVERGFLKGARALDALHHVALTPKKISQLVFDFLDLYDLSSSPSEEIFSNHLQGATVPKEELDAAGLAAIFGVIHNNQEIFKLVLSHGAPLLSAVRVNPYFLHNNKLREPVEIAGLQGLKKPYMEQAKILEKHLEDKLTPVNNTKKHSPISTFSQIAEAIAEERVQVESGNPTRNFPSKIEFEIESLTLSKILSELSEEGAMGLTPSTFYIPKLKKLVRDLRVILEDLELFDKLKRKIFLLEQELKGYPLLKTWLEVRAYNMIQNAHRSSSPHGVIDPNSTPGFVAVIKQ